MSAIIPKDYDQFYGVDLLTPVPSPRRDPGQAQTMKNFQFLDSGSPAARSGFQYKAHLSGGGGYARYTRVMSGESMDTFFTIGQNLNEEKTGTFTISYAGAAINVVVQFLVDNDTQTWFFQVIEDDVEVLLFDCGVGVDEVTPITLADLETAIEGISADYTVTIVGTSTGPATYLPQQVNQALSGAPLELEIEFAYVQEFRTPADMAAALFSGHLAAKNSAGFRNATHINFRQCLLIATEEDDLVKCDGQLSYLAGMPIGAITSVTPTGGGAITANWRYMIRYKHVDAKGNENPGSLSDIVSATMAAHVSANVVIPTIQNTTGYATDQAKVNGAQVGVNAITVDAGHDLKVGDRVFLLDRSASALFGIERNVTAIGATSVTIDGAVVNVGDNDYISNRLSIEIFRTKTNGALWYYVAELPNDSGSASITFVDTTVDASVGDLFIIPDRQPDPPPAGGIITLHQNVPVITRDPDFINRVYWADLLYPEGFPQATNFRDLYSVKGGDITGLAPNVSGLDVFFPDSQYRLYGELADEIFSWRKVSLSQGCLAHDTIQEIDNGRIIWLSRLGPRWMLPGGIPSVPGFGLDPVFHEHGETADRFVTERAVAVDNPHEKMVLFFLPVESESGGDVYANDLSEIWVLDYKASDLPRWVGPWTNLNFAGGAICDNEGRIHFVERRFSEETSTIVTDTMYFHDRNDDFDQMDHNIPIPSEWAPGWESLDSKSRKKLFSWLRVYSMDPNRLSGFTLTVRMESDWLESQGQTFVMQLGNGGGAAGWQFQPWGFFPWGQPSATYKQVAILEPGAFQRRPVFSHNRGYEKPIISLYTMGIQSPWLEGKLTKDV